jgi:hypothetical protein
MAKYEVSMDVTKPNGNHSPTRKKLDARSEAEAAAAALQMVQAENPGCPVKVMWAKPAK